MLTIHFIRHGESTSNAGLPTTHPALTPLTERGLTQANLTALTFDAAPNLIALSPFIRTHQTAQPLRERFPTVPVTEWPVQEFTYLAVNSWSGSTFVERRPAVQSYWERSDPCHRDGEGAESFVDLMERVRQTRALIDQQGQGVVCVFSHGEFSRAFWWRTLFPYEPTDTADAMRRFRSFVRGFRYPNCGILTFHFDGENVWNSPIRIAHLPPELRVL
jgi:broad specificity phosphatase PhoE